MLDCGSWKRRNQVLVNQCKAIVPGSDAMACLAMCNASATALGGTCAGAMTM